MASQQNPQEYGLSNSELVLTLCLSQTYQAHNVTFTPKQMIEAFDNNRVQILTL